MMVIVLVRSCLLQSTRCRHCKTVGFDCATLILSYLALTQVGECLRVVTGRCKWSRVCVGPHKFHHIFVLESGWQTRTTSMFAKRPSIVAHGQTAFLHFEFQGCHVLSCWITCYMLSIAVSLSSFEFTLVSLVIGAI